MHSADHIQRHFRINSRRLANQCISCEYLKEMSRKHIPTIGMMSDHDNGLIIFAKGQLCRIPRSRNSVKYTKTILPQYFVSFKRFLRTRS